jgi:sugar phosphate permease
MTTQNAIIRHSMVNRSPFFYGWVVWGVATIGLMFTAPGQTFSVSLFIDHFIADFNLDRTTVSGLYMVGTFAASLSLTFVGRLIDRYGNRRMGVLIATLFALVLALWSTVAGPVGILLGFLAIRGLGQGSLSINSTTAVAKWFRRRRGLMTSLSLVCFAVVQGVYVDTVRRLIDAYGWRQTWVILGVAVGVILIPLIYLLMRDQPEDFGLQPDGQRLDAGAGADDDEENWTLREAMRTPSFWIFMAGRFMPAAWMTGLVFHQISIFAAVGYSAEVAARIFGLGALSVAVASLASGFLADRLRPGVLLALQLVALCCTLAIAMFMTAPWMLMVYVLFYGMAMGGGAGFDGAVWANLYGRANLGAIRGFATTAMVAGSSIGPLIYGFSFDQTGSYAAAIWLAIGITVVPLILSLFIVKPPQRRLQST